MSNFSEILKELIEETNLDHKSFAERAEISPASLTDYFHKGYLPTISNLIKLANYFNCSCDFLLGRDIERPYSSFKECPPFCERLPYLMEKFGYYPQKLHNETGIPRSRFFEWKNGKRQPSLDNIIKLADKFGCSVDFILGREN